MHPKQTMTRSSRSYFDLSAEVIILILSSHTLRFFLFFISNTSSFLYWYDIYETCQVIEVAPAHCVVQISKSAGDLRKYNEVRKKKSCQLNIRKLKLVNLVTDLILIISFVKVYQVYWMKNLLCHHMTEILRINIKLAA